MKKIFVLLLIIIVLTGCNDSKPKEDDGKGNINYGTSI